MKPFSAFQIASAAIIGVALLLVLPFKLLPALMAGLLVHALINSLTPLLQHMFAGHLGRVLAVGLLSVVVILGLGLIFAGAFSFILHEVSNPGQLLGKLMGLIDRARAQLPDSLVAYLPANVDDIRQTLYDWLRGHISELQLLGRGAVHLFVTVLIGMVLGAVIALQRMPAPESLRPLAGALLERVGLFVMAFRNIVFAQVKISLLNTLFTAVFLVVVLPLFGVHFPLVKTLILVTFVAGLLPVVGNLISNTVIFVVGLSLSIWIALVALGYLVLIHKVEYFLNARIVGAQIKAKSWELLLAMLVFEAAFGLAGLVAAPVYYAYLKSELKGQGWV
ncbi:AI-2E family transporter [Pseudomonas sp. ABC1]|uniref:AI-2E family transporter n=1 Tax=Pseudomonas sp. ABC1 TaxID=2748080 RepID=UPI0015C3D1EB|nr:AI-2E family transporter [Pseudomonas sp. ABC1]QLF92788.1 AI-2E family transporter [Pseudomonas sp. ABC1]